MPSAKELLESIKPDMKLTKNFFKRVYAYEISYQGFSDKAISRLEASGCSRARHYYETWVSEYEAKYNAEMKEVASWYHERFREELRKFEKRQKEGEQTRTKRQQTQWKQNGREQWTEMSEALGFQPIATEN